MARESSSNGGGVAWGSRAEQMPPQHPHISGSCALGALPSCGHVGSRLT